MTPTFSALFVDQTAQLGGAELCLRDIVARRGHGNDRVFLFQDGPLSQWFRAADIWVETDDQGDEALDIRRESGLIGKLTSSRTVGRLAKRVARAASHVDVIYANTPKALVVSSLAGKLARKPVIYHLHDILSTEHFSVSSLALLVFFGRHFASHTIANSRSSADAYFAAGARQGDVTVVHNGIDVEPFTRANLSSQRHRGAIRESIGVGDAPLIALFGRFAPWKGQHIALETLRTLPGTHLMLVGDALFGETDYAHRLHEIASREDLRGRVHFMGFQNDVPAMMQAADIVVHCSTAPEPFGRVIVEAMLSRRPIVATRGGGASEIIRDHETGRLVTPGSAKELSEAVTSLIAPQFDLARMLERAERDARERFNLDDRVADVSAVIGRVALRQTRLQTCSASDTY